MHLKVFLKLKKTLKNSLFWANIKKKKKKKNQKTKKPKNQKKTTGLGLKKKKRVFSNPGVGGESWN
jgi:hypothetical protein